MALLWIALARGVGLVVPEEGSDRLIAARPDFWGENAVHLPQMIATRWLALRDWHEQAGMRQEGSPVDLAAPFLRASVLTWLATCPEPGWVALEDLAAHLERPLPRLGPPAPVRPRPDPDLRRRLRHWTRSSSARPTSSAWSARPRRFPRVAGSSN